MPNATLPECLAAEARFIAIATDCWSAALLAEFADWLRARANRLAVLAQQAADDADEHKRLREVMDELVQAQRNIRGEVVQLHGAALTVIEGGKASVRFDFAGTL